MKVIDVDVNTRAGEWHHITPISDAHIDSEACDVEALSSLLTERARLPRHRFITVGDVGNFVLPKDAKRYSPTVTARKLRGRDDVLGDSVRYIVDVLRGKGRRWDMIAMGNHETSVLHHHAVDVTAQIAGELKARHGGYSGFLRYHLHTDNRRSQTFCLLYHHGAWGGRVGKGLAGLRDWARAHELWDVALCGHNHRLLIDREARIRPSQTVAISHSLTHRDVSFVVCGTHYRSAVDDPDGGPGYEERAGHAPVALGAPLIAFRLCHINNEVARRRGVPQWWVEHKITI